MEPLIDQRVKVVAPLISNREEALLKRITLIACCNLTDHIRLPIIHTKTYINLKQRQKIRTDRIKIDYIITMSPYNEEN